MELSNVLFLDTESNPVTKQPECLQWLIGDKHGIIEIFDKQSYYKIRELWSGADAVVMFNAPYDMGVLSIMYSKNSYKWKITQHGKIKTEKTAAWDMNLFGNRYSVRKISFFRNMIKPVRRTFREYDETIDLRKQRRTTSRRASTPVVDLLKLWAILIDDGSGKGNTGISLKALIKKVLHQEPILYSPETAKSEAYRLQDVFRLRELTDKFFELTSDLSGLSDYTWDNWGYIKTPATFTKLAYRETYEHLADWKKDNDDYVKRYNLGAPLENAFHGGITLSFYRGKLGNTGWVDISGAYSKAIQVLNTDSYLKFRTKRLNIENLKLKSNILLRARVNFVFKTVDKSLKIFKLRKPTIVWIWSDDIKASKNLYRGFRYQVLEAYEFIPQVDVNESLPTEWDRAKGEEKRLYGKTTRYYFHKFRSNTGYGITAQRNPFQTVHTNMVIAGMITAKVHSILTLIIKLLEDLGYKNLYNDTDSSCFDQGKKFTEEEISYIIDYINERIKPFRVEHEGFNKTTHILSLKRYISERGEGKNKIRLHGKGRYNIKEQDIYDYVVNNKVPEKPLMVTQLAANTKIGMGMIIKLFDVVKPYKHPFMFEKNIMVDPRKKTMHQFMHEWYHHIDTKTSFKKTDGSFERTFHIFKNIHKALRYFRAFIIPKRQEYSNMDYRDWDMEIFEDFCS